MDLGFRGAAALVLADGALKGLDGERLLRLIKSELMSMARYLLREFEQLDTGYQIAAIPVLEDLAKQDSTARLEVYRAVYSACSERMSQESTLLQSQRVRLADELYLRGHREEAVPLYRQAFVWLERETKRELRSGGFGESVELQERAIHCLSRTEKAEKSIEEFLAKLSKLYEKAGRDPDSPYRLRLRQARQGARPVDEARAYLSQAKLHLAGQDWEKAEKMAEKALEIAEDELGEESPDLFDFLDTLAVCYEHLLRPQRMDIKSRALILKYKRKNKQKT